MKGFILAAGEGTRLYPLTLEIPKPLLPVGKIPILTYLIEFYLKNGVDDIKINIQKKHLEDFYKWKATYFPREKIEFLIEKKPSGTFTPLIKAGNWFSESIVVSNGDELKELSLKKMIAWYKRKKAIATIGLVKIDDPRSYGSVKMKDGKVIEFAQKSPHPPSNFINSGIFILSPEVKKYYPFKKVKFSMLEEDLFPQLAKEGKLFGYKFKGKWMDTGTFSRYELAIKTWNK
jgi:NDP-sugar pyrophosphorylase family protein